MGGQAGDKKCFHHLTPKVERPTHGKNRLNSTRTPSHEKSVTSKISVKNLAKTLETTRTAETTRWHFWNNPLPQNTLQIPVFPKGPFRTKNTTTLAKVLNYYAVVFLLRPPNLVRRGPFFERKNVCNSQENGVRTRCAAIVNHPAVLKILRVVNLLRVVFLVRRGPLGSEIWSSQIWLF